VIRRLTVVTAVAGLLVAAAPAAVADIPPDPAGWVMARGEPVQWTGASHRWARTAHVVADGPIAGRPGNRRTATVDAQVASTGGPRPGPPAVAVNITVREEDCAAGG
jgi:hypothetical protein